MFTFSCEAATVEEQYSTATNCYESLKNNPERQKYRHNWFNCIQKFAAVYSVEPNHPLASSGMYRAAELYLDLYKISAIEKDKSEALDLLNRVIKRYPSSTDRDMAEKLLSSLKSSRNNTKKEDSETLSYKKENSSVKKTLSNQSVDSEQSKSNHSSGIISSAGNAYITDLRYWTTPDYTRIVINVSDERRYIYQLLDENPSMKQPKRLYLDIKKSIIGKNLPAHTRINDDLLLQARAGQRTDDSVRVVVDIKSFDSYKVFSMSDPFRVIIDVWGEKSEKNREADSLNASDVSSDINSDVAIKRATKKLTKTSNIPVSTDALSDSDNVSSSNEISSKLSTKTATRLSPSSSSSSSSSSSASSAESSLAPVQSSKLKISSEEPLEAASKTNSKETSNLTVKKSLKASTMVLSDATRKMLRKSLAKSTEEIEAKSKTKEESEEALKEPSGKATKGTTRVVQIAPGSNVDKIKASSIAKQLALGVRTIVIDPGHGGKDPGASGHKNGIYEKDIVLSISKRLSRRIKDRLNCNVIMTRSSDSYLTLEERTAIANTRSADLFISLHCNASNDSSLVGIETYYLNLATDERAINVAARENATSRKNISDLESILNDLMKNAKINESSRLSSVVQNSLYKGMAKKYSKIKNLGVKQAPFYVLLGASMPSILIETSFLSNPEECRRLTDSAYQNALCDSITDGIAKYIRETNPQRL